MGWSFDPLQLAPLAVLAALSVRRLRSTAGAVPAAAVASLAAGLAVVVAALVTPIAAIGEHRLFAVHMAQHLLIGDVAPLLLVLGLRAPLPLGRLGHPLVAVSLWAADLWLWHLPLLYDGALRHELVHALEHACFLGGGILLWHTVLDRRRAPGTRFAALGAVWVNGMALANVFLWSGRAWYGPYIHAPRTWGLSPLADQREGGGVMLAEMMVVGLATFVVIGLAWLEETEQRERRRERRAGVVPAEPG